MVDVSGTAGTVFGIAGMGIGLGLLAHTASNIARSTDRMYDRQERGRGYGREREEPRRGFGLRDTSQRGRREGGFGRNRVSTCRYPREEPRPTRASAPRRSFGSGFGESSFRFNPRPMSLTRPNRSFRW